MPATITMCTNSLCNQRQYCYRYRAIPLPRGQKYINPDEQKCLMFMEVMGWGNTRTLISRSILPRLAGRSNRDYDHAPAEIKPVIMATARLAQSTADARSKNKKGERHDKS